MAKIVRITSRKPNFRRCGIAHPAKATDYPMSRFTGVQLERLQGEPNLIVSIVEREDPKAAPGKKDS